MPYDVFISYSRKDKNAVQSIIKHLDEHGVSYWIDLEGIYSGEEFAGVIHDNMLQSDVVLFFSSANSNQSKWVSGEIAMADSLGKRIIPFRLDDTPYNGTVHLYLAALDAINYYDDKKQALDHLVRSLQMPSHPVSKQLSTRKTKQHIGANTVLLFSILSVLTALFVFLLLRNENHAPEQFSINNANISIASIDSINIEQSRKDTIISTPSPTEKISAKTKVGQSNPIKATASNQQVFVDGNVLKLNIDGIHYYLKKIEGGDFMMGATGRQKEFSKDDEKNVRRIHLDSYFIGETEITVSLWNKIMKQGTSASSGKPKTGVSYQDCCDFCEILSNRYNLDISLPTEAEWEYAAKTGSTEDDCIYSGSAVIDDIGWYSMNTDTICSVATKKPNKSGIYDMSGNAAEWCLDWYGKSYTSSQSNNPEGPYSGSERVVRGGSFVSADSECRTTARDHIPPERRADYIGFRIVCHYNQ